MVYNLESQGPLKIVINSAFGGRSHVKGIFEIMNELIQKGHQISYAALEDNLSFTQWYNISKINLGPGFIEPKIMRDTMIQVIENKDNINGYKMMEKVLASLILSYYEKTYPSLENYLNNTKMKPDLLICDFFSPACIDLAKKNKIPLITSFQSPDFPQVDTMPYITETRFDDGPLYINELSFLQRIHYFIFQSYFTRRSLNNVLNNMNELRNKFQVPKSNQILGDLNYGLKIATTFTGFEPPLPLLPNMLQIGPINNNNNNNNQLNEELETFLNSHERILYIGFGSNAILNPNLISKLLQNVVKAIELNIIDSVIWGLGQTTYEDFPKQIQLNGQSIDTSLLFDNQINHIKFLKWAPQINILNHSNVKLFLSHGGLESLFEAINSGTLILCLPLFGDQFRNCKKVEMMNIGLSINRKTLDSDLLVNKIQIILNDKDQQFIAGITKMKTLVYHSNQKKYLAAELIEQYAYMAKACRQYLPFNSSWSLPPCEVQHLISNNNNSNWMNWIIFNGIDVYFTSLIFILLSGLSLTFLFKKLYKLLRHLELVKLKQN